jgi:hypothetical protein
MLMHRRHDQWAHSVVDVVATVVDEPVLLAPVDVTLSLFIDVVSVLLLVVVDVADASALVVVDVVANKVVVVVCGALVAVVVLAATVMEVDELLLVEVVVGSGVDTGSSL